MPMRWAQPVQVGDRQVIEVCLRRDPFLHLYELGDLDDFFWPCTTWYGCWEQGQLAEVALLYRGTGMPVLLALTPEPGGAMTDLLAGLVPHLPPRLYAHLSPGLLGPLADHYQARFHGPHRKMGLTDPARLKQVRTDGVVPLGPADRPELEALYQESYPDNWFDPRMLETGCYFCLRRQGRLVSAAGVHVYSPRYRVAALGNVTTHPAYRGRGLARAVCARLCQVLLPVVDYIGLNVAADNAAAIACYRSLGFEQMAVYEEFALERRDLSSGAGGAIMPAVRNGC